MRILCFCLLLTVLGCGRSIEAERAATMIELSAINHSRNMDRVVEGFIADYRKTAREKADDLSANAIKSITKTVDGEKVANPNNVQFILKQKAKHYAKIEVKCIGMRRKILLANKDIEHILAYSKALKGYFNQRASFGELLNESSATVIEALDAFTGKKGDDE